MRHISIYFEMTFVGFFVGALCISIASVSAATDHPGDAARGKMLFEKRCTGCHSLDQDKEGPRLHDVYGRQAGTVPNFPYSDALKTAHITWDEASLDKWLTDTESVVPNNEMAFHVPSAEERADIIRFLQVSSGR
jgi:cytochrome c